MIIQINDDSSDPYVVVTVIIYVRDRWLSFSSYVCFLLTAWSLIQEAGMRSVNGSLRLGLSRDCAQYH